jgi:putative NADH-flavin reductase
MSKPVIGVLGGTGNVGKVFVEESLKKGYKIIALVRNPDKVTPADGLELVKGDAKNADDVAGVVQKSDVVVSMVGPVKGAMPILTPAVENILAANPKRVIMITSLGVNGSSCIVKCLLKRCINGNKKGIENNGFLDAENADSLLQDASCDWTLIRPTYMEDLPPRGRIKATASKGAACSWMCNPVSKADVACFMVDQLENQTWNKKAVHLHKGSSDKYSNAPSNGAKVAFEETKG